jgi:hypothetical protein
MPYTREEIILWLGCVQAMQASRVAGEMSETMKDVFHRASTLEITLNWSLMQMAVFQTSFSSLHLKPKYFLGVKRVSLSDMYYDLLLEQSARYSISVA